MVSFPLTSAIGLVSSLYLCTVVNALPIPTTPTSVEARSWPATGRTGQLGVARNEDTNAQRLARGEPLKQPIRKDKLKARFDTAPSQAASTTDSETFDYVSCATGGFYYYGNQYTLTFTSDQDLVDACAEEAAKDGESAFAVEDGGGTCYTGVGGYESLEEACASDNYAIYASS